MWKPAILDLWRGRCRWCHPRASTLNCHAWWPASKNQRVWASIGILTSYESNWNFKIELCVWLSVLRLFYVCHVEQNGWGALCLLGTNGYHVKAKNEWFTAAGSRCRHVVVWETTSQICTKKRAALVAWLFFLIQPIISLVCSVDVAFVISSSLAWMKSG